MQNIVEDLTEWPIGRYTFTGSQSLLEIEEFLERLEGLLGHGEDFCVVLDMQSYSSDITQMKHIGRWLLSQEGDQVKRCCGLAINTTNGRALTLMLNAFFLITPFPFPHRIFNDLSQAHSWTQECLSPKS